MLAFGMVHANAFATVCLPQGGQEIAADQAALPTAESEETAADEEVAVTAADVVIADEDVAVTAVEVAATDEEAAATDDTVPAVIDPAQWLGEIRVTLDTSAAWQFAVITNPTVGSVGGEWTVFSLARGGFITDEYASRYLDNLEAYVKERAGVLDVRTYTEYSRVIIALSSIGVDAHNVAGYDLVAPLAEYEKVAYQRVNGPAFALIALDSRGYEIPALPSGSSSTQATRDRYIDHLLAFEHATGGWSLGGAGSSAVGVDVTAMVIQALAPYCGTREDVRAAVSRALDVLSALQDVRTGGFGWDADSPESDAQVIVALNALGIPLDDARFVKDGKTAYSSIMRYYLPALGAFSHSLFGGASPMATDQAMYALVSLYRSLTGATALYDTSDVTARELRPDTSSDEGDPTDGNNDNGNNDNSDSNNDNNDSNSTEDTNANVGSTNRPSGGVAILQQGAARITSPPTFSNVYPVGEVIGRDVFEAIAGKDVSIRVGDEPRAVGDYSFIFNGTEITAAADFDASISFNSPNTASIGKLAEDAFVFCINDAPPGRALVHIMTNLPSGSYTFFRYDAAVGKAVVEQKVTVTGGLVSFFITREGDYFIAQRALKVSVDEVRAHEGLLAATPLIVTAPPAVAVASAAGVGVDGLPAIAYGGIVALVALVAGTLGVLLGHRRVKPVGLGE